MIRRSWLVLCDPGRGRILSCRPVVLDGWYRSTIDGDPDAMVFPTQGGGSMVYPGEAVRALVQEIGANVVALWMDPRTELEPLFGAMGWDPDVVWVEGALSFVGTVLCVVSAWARPVGCGCGSPSTHTHYGTGCCGGYMCCASVEA